MSKDNIKIGLRRATPIRAVDQNNEVQNFFFWDTGFPGFVPSDQYTRSLDFTFAQAVATDITLAVAPVAGSYNITFSEGHGFTGGELISLYDPIDTNLRFYAGEILSMAGNIATLDSPVIFAFNPLNTIIFQRYISMAIDGSTSTKIFSIVNPFNISADFTRLNFHLRGSGATAMDDSKFGNLGTLTRGLTFRKKISGSEYYNYWTVKDNGTFGMLGTKEYQDKAPAGEYGVSFRVSYAGMEKHGVALRVDPGEALEILVQDNLSGLTFFRSGAQGHLTR